MGVPFANSARERRIRDLLDKYKERAARRDVDLLGSERLRRWFAGHPTRRTRRDRAAVLGMYRGRADGDAATARRFDEWEQRRRHRPRGDSRW